jgi:antitoxin component YwqK of YwqJK toxin-antitoxin module
MNKLIITLTTGMICCCASYGQKHGKDTIIRYLDNRLEFVKKSNSVFPAIQVRSGDHWVLFSVYPDTGSLLKAYFQDEDLQVKDGPFTLYHRKRIKALEGSYKDNVKQGAWAYWYQNGQMKDSGAYKNNYYVGKWKSWDDSGRLTSIVHYTDTSRITHIAQTMTTERQRKVSILAGDTVVGVMNGPATKYYANGNLLDSGAYISDRKTGLWKHWYQSGALESTGPYTGDKQEGEWTYYRENGTRSTKEKYVNNKVAALECFDEQGNASGNSCSILKPPVAQGKFLDFDKYALDNMFWPKELKNVDISGDVILEYTISKEGKLINLKILSTPHPLMRDEVTRFFKTLTDWSPAISHNRPVEYTVKYKVPFYK